jgi:hypothetical protein
VRQLDSGAQQFQRPQVQVDGPRTDGAAAGQGDPRFLQAGHQRPQNQDGSTHLAHQVVGRLVVVQAAGIHLHGVVRHAAAGPQVGEQLQGAVNVPQIGHVGKGVGPVAQQRGRQAG